MDFDLLIVVTFLADAPVSIVDFTPAYLGLAWTFLFKIYEQKRLVKNACLLSKVQWIETYIFVSNLVFEIGQ